MRKIPTAQEIVDVFKKNGWEKTCNAIFKKHKYDQSKPIKCCVIPALCEIAKIEDWEENLSFSISSFKDYYDYHDENGTIYNKLKTEFGLEYSESIWNSFDRARPSTINSEYPRDTEMSRVCAEASRMLDE